MTDIVERLDGFIANIPDGVHTCSDFCLKPNCLIVSAKREIEALRARVKEVETENVRLIAANKARDEFLRGHRYKHSEVDGYIDLCESQMAALKARAEQAEARVKECEKVMIHYGMETEHSCMCQFLNDTDTLSSECHYHEQIRLRAEQAERERDEALQHEGEKDTRIDELLAYLRYDPETQSHFDWVGGYEQVEAERNTLISVVASARERAEQAERDAARRLELLREARVGVKNSAVQFGYPYTDLVDRIDAELEKP